MGLILSRFRRKKTTSEILDRLETKIKTIERDGEYTEQKHKKIIGYVMAYSVGLYILFAVLYYYMYIGKSQHWLNTILYALPLLVLPILVILLRSSITWYYSWSLDKNRSKLNRMRVEKKKILEEVMNTETYKVAKEILDKYGGSETQPTSRAIKPFVPTANVLGNTCVTTPIPSTPGQLRQRQLALQTNTPSNSLSIVSPNSPFPSYNTPRLTSRQLPHPLLNNDRTIFEKVVDYMVKDGPTYRMALICKECCSHNGMVMIEEFEYISYKCAYCSAYNPARKQRPAAPPLTPRPILNAIQYDEDTPAASSASDSDEENKDLHKSGSENEMDRTSSPSEKASISEEKKQD